LHFSLLFAMPHKLCPLGEDQDFVNPRRSVAYAMLGDRIGYIPKRLVMPDRSSEGRYIEKEWYFFTPRDRKYQMILVQTSAAGTGYWNVTGAHKPVGKPKT
ncbi:hypothetical protein HID58_034344, partial [Brassica napus]